MVSQAQLTLTPNSIPAPSSVSYQTDDAEVGTIMTDTGLITR